jgi:toxin-antitoxin system PIN domain toxin
MTFLLDTNALMALAWENHEHHGIVTRWLRGVTSFATCPMTQGGFVRISSNPALGYANSTAEAFRSLDSIICDHRHAFWPDDLSFGAAEVRRELIGSHTQVTDKYLAALAFLHKGNLATFDQGLAKAFADESPLVSLIK